MPQAAIATTGITQVDVTFQIILTSISVIASIVSILVLLNKLYPPPVV